MAKTDLMNNIDLKRGISPAATAADNTAIVSQIVDTRGYESATFVILTGSLPDADATFAVTIDHGDVSNLSDAASVPTDMLLGTTALAGFTFAADDSVRKIGYVGPKRYVRVTITPAANSSASLIAGVWILGHPALVPTANPPA
jgi:hypothetical protein